jgi:MoxR-like ATPase
MRPIPAPRIGDSHGLLRAIEQRGRLRTDEFVTEFSLEQLFAPELENALGRMRHFVSYARSAGLVKEDRGVVELTEVGRRYVRAGDDRAPFDVSSSQAEWLRRQLREKHMTDSIFHGLAIGLSLLASAPPASRASTRDFGRSLAYLGRAGWDNENTFQIQGERYLTLLTDLELIDGEHRLTHTGEQVRGELTLPVHMSLLDIAAQLNPGGAEAVRAAGEAEWPPAPAAAPEAAEDNGYEAGAGAWSPPAATNGEGQIAAPERADPAPPAEAPLADLSQTAGPEDSTKAIPSVRPPIVPRASDPATPVARATETTPGDRLPDTMTPAGDGRSPPPTAGSPPARDDAAAAVGGDPAAVGVPAAAGGAVGGDLPAAGEALRGDPAAFVDPAAIRAAAESAGLRFPVAVYANVAAALGAGKHVVLTGAPGAGKTSLALAIARAAAQAGRAHGATLVSARHRWTDQDLLVDSAKRGRWVIVDELDRARLDRSLGELSSFLSGLPVLLPSGEEAEPDAGWRIVATAARAPRASAALLRRFAVVEVPPPAGHVLVEALSAAAGGDATAMAAVARLLPLAEVAPLGAGVFLDAARHAAARQAAAPTDDATLARDAFAAYVAPLLGGLDEDAAHRVREILGDG